MVKKKKSALNEPESEQQASSRWRWPGDVVVDLGARGLPTTTYKLSLPGVGGNAKYCSKTKRETLQVTEKKVAWKVAFACRTTEGLTC